MAAVEAADSYVFSATRDAICLYKDNAHCAVILLSDTRGTFHNKLFVSAEPLVLRTDVSKPLTCVIYTLIINLHFLWYHDIHSTTNTMRVKCRSRNNILYIDNATGGKKIGHKINLSNKMNFLYFFQHGLSAIIEYTFL